MITITKQKLVYAPDGRVPWMASHAQLPTPLIGGDKTLRVYFGTRDSKNRTRPTFVDVELNEESAVAYLHHTPVLDLGEPGTFDDCGVMPSCVFSCQNRHYLYYIGFNTSGTVPYRLAVGLATSDDGGATFQRACRGAVLDRTAEEPFLVTAPFVAVENGLWRMWYVCGTGWIRDGERYEPTYDIRLAESPDGVNWKQRNHVCIPCRDDTEAVGRPWVVKRSGGYHMFYCYRSVRDYRTNPANSYRIGYAVSRDGLDWDRRDDSVTVEGDSEEWDSGMLAYPSVIAFQDRWYLFYNGSGFGRSGFGYATIAF